MYGNETLICNVLLLVTLVYEIIFEKNVVNLGLPLSDRLSSVEICYMFHYQIFH